MIRPTKYMDLKYNVISIAAEVLAELQRTHIVSLEELDLIVQARIDEKARINFIPALNFLFLTGCLDYDKDNDAVFYLTRSGGNQ